MHLILRALLIVVIGAAFAHADIYKSVDENGVVCYTDMPTAKGAEKVIKSRSDGARQNNTGDAGAQTETMARKNVHSIVKEKAEKYAMDPSLVHAVIKAESNGNQYAVSKKGAMGLMQLMPSTASDLQVGNPFDAEENIDGGTRYLKSLIERFKGDLTLALAAYNAGPKKVEQAGAVPKIPETKQYVKKVLSLYNGATILPIASLSSVSGQPSAAATAERPERIYKVLTEDGTLLFTNSPLAKQYSRF